MIAKATLTIFHVSPDQQENWTRLSRCETDTRAVGILPKNSPRSAVPDLGIKVKKVIAQEKDPGEIGAEIS